MRRLATLAVAVVVGTACQSADTSIDLELAAEGLDRPLGLVHAGDGTGRLFIVEQGGTVRVLAGGQVLDEPFLDVSDRVSCCGERGLLGLAFHPDYVRNRYVFINYTNTSGDTIVSRFTTSEEDADRADSDSEVELLRIEQPYSNHNGGHVVFGPDSHLYVGTGDGGSGGDPQNNAQNLGNLLGKILRLDVDAGMAAAPPDNPFTNDPAARDEIWAYGLRNPWRFSFDRSTGDLFIGDVGQDSIEEINHQPSGSRGGENYGWRLKEGSSCFNPTSNCDSGSVIDPILEYDHGEGCSVTGGFRYRGPASPLAGLYVYGDYCSGKIWGADRGDDGSWSERLLADTELSISSFGEDEDGQLYVVSLEGEVHRIVGR